MKCRDCRFLSEPKVFGEGGYPSVRCNLGLWDKNGIEHWHSYGETQLNRGPVRRFGEACTRGEPKGEKSTAGKARIYIASSWKNQEEVIALAEKLEAEGFQVDAFCRATDDRYVFHWSELVDSEDELKYYNAIEMLADPRTQRAFQEDRKWLNWANCVILLMPCGRSSHMEAGYGKGQGKLLYIFGDFPKGEFDVMYGLADRLFRREELPEMVEEIKRRILL